MRIGRGVNDKGEDAPVILLDENDIAMLKEAGRTEVRVGGKPFILLQYVGNTDEVGPGTMFRGLVTGLVEFDAEDLG